MKRKLVIATLTAAVLIGGGTAAAFADGDDDAAEKGAKAAQNVSVEDDGDGDRDGRDDRDDRDDKGDDRDDDRGERDDDQARPGDLTIKQAIDAALKSQAGTAVSADLDGDGGTRAWEVDILGKGATTYTVHVDAGSGKVLGTETENRD